MKITTILFLLFCHINFSLIGQTQCLNQPDSYWYIGAAFGSAKVSSCNIEGLYDCHGFTKSYFEAGCQPALGATITTAFPCPPQTIGSPGLSWQTSGKYVPVCSESNANVVFYGVTTSGGIGHSAVKLGASGKYMSKYGKDGPLVTHDLNGSWYHYLNSVTSTNFWAYIGPITGNASVVGLGNQTYSVISKPGVKYSWIIYSGGDKISISSAFNQNTVTLSPLHSGAAILRLSSTSTLPGCGHILNVY